MADEGSDEDTQLDSAYKELVKTCKEQVLTIHIPIKVLTQKVKESPEKREILQNFEIGVSALRNSNGGFFLVHLCNKTALSLNLEDFDTFVDRSLKYLIGDGSAFVDVYSRSWLSKVHERFGRFQNVLLLTVQKSLAVSTVIENTKVCSDLELERPSTFELYSLISKEKSDDGCSPKIRGIENVEDLHESRSIQLKRLTDQIASGFREGPEWLKKFSDYIWKTLRFQEYLTSMSKIPHGGSYYLGIAQETKTEQLKIEGFELAKRKRKSLSDEILNRVKDVLILKEGGRFITATDERDLVNISFHNVQGSQRVVIEIAIRYVAGIVFYENGPKAYKILFAQDGHVHVSSMPSTEWLQRLRQIAKERMCEACRERRD